MSMVWPTLGPRTAKEQEQEQEQEVSLHANNQLDSSSGFDTVPACDGRTDRHTDRRTTDRGTHDDSINRANIASRGKIVD